MSRAKVTLPQFVKKTLNSPDYLAEKGLERKKRGNRVTGIPDLKEREMHAFILILLFSFSIPPLLFLPPGSLLPHRWQRFGGSPRRDAHRSVRKGKGAPGTGGFTIVEIAISLMIVGILAAIAIPAYTNYVDRSLVKLTIKNIRLLEQSIKAFEIENMRLPNGLNEMGPVELLSANGDPITQSAPFLDPYGNPFRYLNFANEPPGWPNCRTDQVDRPLSLDYDLYSMGADGLTQKKLNHATSVDDIVRARSGKFVDIATRY